MTPWLFNMFMGGIMREECTDIPGGCHYDTDGKWKTGDYEYTDDIVLFSEFSVWSVDF